MAVGVWGLAVTSAHFILLFDGAENEELRLNAFIYVLSAIVLVILLVTAASQTFRALPFIDEAKVSK